VPEERRDLLAGIIPLTAHDRSRGLDTRGLVVSAGNTHAILGQGGAAYVISTTELPPERHTIGLDGAIVACSVARDRRSGVTACMGSESRVGLVVGPCTSRPLRKIAVADVTGLRVVRPTAPWLVSSRRRVVRARG